MLKKNEEYIVNIIDQGMSGEGIAKIDNITVFVAGAIKGEKVKVLITKVLSSLAYAKLIEIISKSNSRIDVDCKTYRQCGGCSLRHMTYEHTLRLKADNVRNCFKKNLIEDVVIEPCIGMKSPIWYRNKLQYPLRA